MPFAGTCLFGGLALLAVAMTVKHNNSIEAAKRDYRAKVESADAESEDLRAGRSNSRGPIPDDRRIRLKDRHL